VTYLDELMSRIGIGISPDEGGGEIRASAMVTAPVGVETLERQVLRAPWRLLDGVWLKEWNDMIFDRDILTAPDR
jgi:hypothetical protein